MLYRRHLVPAVICSLALCINVAAEVPLDMAPDAVDDMYKGCTKDALNKFVLSDLLKEEINSSEAFLRAWRHSQISTCSKLIPGGVKEHTMALQTYVNSADTFRTTLNNAVYTYGTNTTTYYDNFHFKSLHFFLMDSIRLLNPGTCRTVHAFSDPKFSVQKGSTVRFGRFYLAFSNQDILKERDWEDEVILDITTCFSADLGDNICHDDPITLLSPTEEFTVEDVKTIEDENASYKRILLKHSELKSMHNCYMFSRSSDDAPSHWLVLVLLTSSFFVSR